MKLAAERWLDQLLTQFMPRFDHQGEVLGSPFLDARLAAIWAVTDEMRADGVQHGVAPTFGRDAGAQQRQEFADRLQRPLEAYRPGLSIRLHRRHRHQLPNEIVGRQMHVKLVANSVRRLAAEVVHLQHDLETSQVELGLPTSSVELGNLRGWILLRATNRTPQTLVQDIYPYATTNPVWIESAVSAPAPTEDARYFMRWIDRVIESASARDDYNTDEEREQTLRYLRDARAVYEAKANAH